MDLIKTIPWLLTAVLVVVCYQQRETIISLEGEKSLLTTQLLQMSAKSKPKKKRVKNSLRLQKMSRLKSEGNDTVANRKAVEPRSDNNADVDNQINSVDMDSMIEERARERVEEIEEERRQERYERIGNRIQNKTEAWANDYDWSSETESAVHDILMTTLQDRMDVRWKIQSGELEREEIRQAFTEIDESRNEQIIELIGEEQFSQIEEELHPRRPPRN